MMTGRLQLLDGLLQALAAYAVGQDAQRRQDHLRLTDAERGAAIVRFDIRGGAQASDVRDGFVIFR